jgi:arylformamidase
MNDWIDVSVPIRHGMVHWPDNPAIAIESRDEMLEGGICRVSKISLGVHTGTHVDAPIHFDVPGGGVESLPLSSLIGVARVIAIAGRAIDRASLEHEDIGPGERILFKTTNSERCWTTDDFVADYVYLTSDAAAYLVSCDVRAVGIDYLSIGGASDGPATHRALLRAGICILEGLDLRRVAPGTFDLIALPILIPGSDGAPARVLLRRR